MKLLNVVVRRPVLTTMITVVMVVMGLYSYRNLVIELFPKIDFPVIVVTTVYPGASPGEVESQVTKRIEDVVGTLASIEDLSSESREGISQVVIQFALETSADQDAIDVKDKIEAIASGFPEDAHDPVVVKFDLSASPIVDLALSGDLSLAELYEIADKTVKERLSRIPGVADVVITGQREREIRVAIAPERLRAYGLTLIDVIQILAAGNLNVPSGQITRENHEITLRMKGEVSSPAEIAEFRLWLPSGQSIPLSEVAEVIDTTEEVRESATLNGRPVIGLGVQKRSDGNTVEVADGVFEALRQLRPLLGEGVELTIVDESASFVRASVNDVLVNIGIGILLAGGLLFVFVHDWRQTLIAAIAMPVSVVASFLLIESSGFAINVMTLMALGISIGTLVTNSIVVIESISRLLHQGVPPEEAASRGTAEVGVAVLASTLTNVVVFTPIAFMSGIIGRVFVQFGMTVVYATLFSLIVSFTLVPMLAARLLKPGTGIGGGDSVFARGARAWDRFYGRIEGGYRQGLAWALTHRRYVLPGATVLFLFGLFLFRFLGGEFIPAIDQGRFNVEVELPAGTSLERTEAVTAEVERIIRRRPEVRAVTVQIGGDQLGVEDALLYVYLVDAEERELTPGELINAVRPDLAMIPDARIALFVAGESGRVESDIILRVLGDDPVALSNTAGQVLGVLKEVPGLVEVSTSDKPGKPEINVLPRRRQLASRGMTAAQVGSILRTAYEGTEAGVYREGGEEYDVVVQFASEYRHDQALLGDLPLTTPAGYTVPLSDIAVFESGMGSPAILHYDKQRMIELGANIAEGSLSEKRRVIDAGLAALDLPDGVTVEYGGDAEMQDESFAAIFEALALAIVLLYIVMAAVLESFVHPVTVMVTLPLALVGMAMGLFLTGERINIMSLMALVMMLGIVVNNAILMLDYTSQLRGAGLSLREALLKACPTRLRPILIANLAIAVGMLPQALGGAGSEFRVPMAVVQIGGVLVSACFTLFVIPAVYTIFDRLTLSGRREARSA